METNNKALAEAEAFINKYCTLAHDHYMLPLALWAAATHTWPTFDCFPYLVITAYVKRAGKTRLMECMQLISSNGRTFSPDSPSSMFRSLAGDGEDDRQVSPGSRPTMFIDEAEKLNAENHPAREFLNKGYKRGQTIPRVKGNEVIDFECFCPKSFVLIGDVYDTLRDRSIVVTMRRRTPVEAANESKFRRVTVEPEAEIVRGQLHEAIVEHQAEIESNYAAMDALTFLNDRDEELWSPLFAIAKVLCPERLDELTRSAVDIATEKTAPKRNFRELMATEEQKADDLEDGVKLLRDMLKLTEGHKAIASVDVVEKLKDIPTSPWRAFRGVGISMYDVAYLLDAMNIHPKAIRNGKKRTGGKQPVFKGYQRADLLAAAQLVGLK